MISRTSRIAIAAALAGGLTAVALTTAVAHAPQPQTANGRNISAVTSVSSSSRTNLNVPPNTWVNLRGASAKVTVPSGWRSALIISTLNAEGICAGGSCKVRITIDGHVTNPAVNPDGFLVAQRNATLVRSLTIGPGTHTVRVQAGIDGGAGGAVRVDAWSLIVETARSR